MALKVKAEKPQIGIFKLKFTRDHIDLTNQKASLGYQLESTQQADHETFTYYTKEFKLVIYNEEPGQDCIKKTIVSHLKFRLLCMMRKYRILWYF